MLHNKGMVWYAEFVISIFIFLLAIGTYFEYRNNILTEESSLIADMIAEGKILSSGFVSNGIPGNWTPATVKQIGLTDGNYRINFTKLDMFESMNISEVQEVYKLRNNYYIQFLDRDDSIIQINGSAGLGAKPVGEDERVSMTRIVIHNHSIVKMKVDIWR